MTAEDYTKMVARNLRRIAYENGKTQTDIANDLGISKATVSSWMNGTRLPRMEKIDLLCHYFNCKRVDIMEDRKKNPEYYVDDEARELAQFLCENPQYRSMFNASRSLKKEDVRYISELIDRLVDYRK